jgi:hypothetical protein
MLIHHAPEGFWTGQSREIGIRDGVPLGWILASGPPEIPDGKVAMWSDAWVIVDAPTPPLDELKAAACAQMRALRRACHISVTYNAVEFVSDDTAATRLTAAITARQTAQALGLEATDAVRGWEAKDGTMIPMTLNDLRGLLLAGVAKTQAAFDRQAQLTALINASATPEALAAIDLTSGWP